jgi:hypothetical protein
MMMTEHVLHSVIQSDVWHCLDSAVVSSTGNPPSAVVSSTGMGRLTLLLFHQRGIVWQCLHLC